MDEKLRGDEGYKDGCWTPIREGLSLVTSQKWERGGWREINTRQYLETGERLLWQSPCTFVMPVCCHGNISRASSKECQACVQALTVSVVTTEIVHWTNIGDQEKEVKMPLTNISLNLNQNLRGGLMSMSMYDIWNLKLYPWSFWRYLIVQLREELSSVECDGGKARSQSTFNLRCPASVWWGNTTHCVHCFSVLLEMNSI